MSGWTSEQVLALAPDTASASAGRGLANPKKWVSRGGDQRILWGACQGSGKNPYQTLIDLQGPTFSCSCPSRKFPCKHGLGLFLMYADKPSAFKGDTPAWVAEWASKREQKAEAKTKRATEEDTPEAQAKRAKSQAKTASKREDAVEAGIAGLSLWLHDLARQGLAQAQNQPPRFWDEAARRLKDAQAPGLERMVRELGSLPARGGNWAEQMLEEMGLLQLAIAGYGRLATLPAPVQADLRTLIGWTHDQTTLEAGPSISDTWCVLGQRTEEDERLTVERSWLRGLESGRDALVVHFAPNQQPTRSGLLVGTQWPGVAYFHPSNQPLRALVRPTAAIRPLAAQPAGYPHVAALFAAWADALSRNPWLDRWPALLQAVTPMYQDSRWVLRDAQGEGVLLDVSVEHGWQLVALAGGAPVTIFGEWDGTRFQPLSLWADGQFVVL